MKPLHGKIILSNNVLKSEKGFILLVAIIACVILMGLGILVFWSSNEDLRTSVVSLGEKRALAAVESGYHLTVQNFDPLIPSTLVAVDWMTVDATYDPKSQYKRAAVQGSPFAALPPPGFSMESAAGFGMARYDVTISGRNTEAKTEQQVDVGVAYGPVDLSLVYK
jgi:hypothetical protein